jgi:hypothetical protein
VDNEEESNTTEDPFSVDIVDGSMNKLNDESTVEREGSSLLPIGIIDITGGDNCTSELPSTSYREQTMMRHAMRRATLSESSSTDLGQRDLRVSMIDQDRFHRLIDVRQWRSAWHFDHLIISEKTKAFEEKKREVSLTVEGNDPSVDRKHWTLIGNGSSSLHLRHGFREANLNDRREWKKGTHGPVMHMLNKHICSVLDECVTSDEGVFSTSTMICSSRSWMEIAEGDHVDVTSRQWIE